MNYRKLISCLLIAVLLLQVVSVGGVASAETLTPVEQMNEIKNLNKDIEEVVLYLQSVLEDDGIIGLDSIYNQLDSIQKSEIARGMILLLPSGMDYSSSDQILDVFFLLHELVVLPREKIRIMSNKYWIIYTTLRIEKPLIFFLLIKPNQWLKRALNTAH